jgi:hypothetical protein
LKDQSKCKWSEVREPKDTEEKEQWREDRCIEDCKEHSDRLEESEEIGKRK